jgi:CheY-like chemotaxis protein
MKTPDRILLIDDDPDDQLFFREAIQSIHTGMHCEMTNNFREALSKLENQPLPQIIFMDLNMPVMNGFDCLIYLKNHPAYKDIPVIIFTTSRNMHDMSRTKQLGARSFMTKPDDFKVLCQKLEKILFPNAADSNYAV